MIKQYISKKKHIAKGFINTILGRFKGDYEYKSWWDSVFYTSGISDSKTIAQKADISLSMYHYASVEQIILGVIYNKCVDVSKSNVLDIGSGAGHWVNFWQRLNAKSIMATDISTRATDFLSKAYKDNGSIKVCNCDVSELARHTNNKFDIVSAVGVMFHVVDDAKWTDSICAISQSVEDGGILVVGGHFGILNGVNVQIDSDGSVNKRLRSFRKWKRVLNDNGFSDVRVIRNSAYLSINGSIPENNIIVAIKNFPVE